MGSWNPVPAREHLFSEMKVKVESLYEGELNPATASGGVPVGVHEVLGHLNLSNQSTHRC